ncbi:MAG: endo-1,4-beta-xylanase, partial [Acidimicrobiia bacterium]
VALGAVAIPMLTASPTRHEGSGGGRSETTTLRAAAGRRRRGVGTALAAPTASTDPHELALVAREYSSVTPENAMKWDTIHPARDRYDFAAADAIVAFATSHHMTVRGHTLAWYRALPTWLTDGHFDREQLIGILRDHIHTVVGHFRGRVQQWDVVNEPLDPSGAGLRDDFWSRGIGPDYIALAFRFAHEADPGATLYVNEFGTDTVNRKSNALLREVTALRKQGVPVDGVGFQMHRNLDHAESHTAITTNLTRFSDAGLRVWITELDVALRTPVEAGALDRQAEVYRGAVQACLTVDRCDGITTWGFTDRHSWIPAAQAGRGAALPFDERLRPKPAFRAMVGAFSA